MTEQGLPSDRIVTLDIIRGVAVMGIFSVNIIAFAMIEAAYFNPPAYGGWHGADLGLWAGNMLVIDARRNRLLRANVMMSRAYSGTLLHALGRFG